jgi:protoporphyrinogen oxidase
MSKYSPYNCPKGHTSFGVEIPCSFQDDIWNMSGDKIAKVTMEYLANENIIKMRDLLGHITCKERYVYPVPSFGYYREVEKLRNSIGLSNLYIAGRMGYFKYLDMCDAMESGKRAAYLFNSKLQK